MTLPTGGAVALSRFGSHVAGRTAQPTIVRSETIVFDAPPVIRETRSRPSIPLMMRPPVAVAMPTIDPGYVFTGWVAPRTGTGEPTIDPLVRVYLTGRDRSVVTLTSEDC